MKTILRFENNNSNSSLYNIPFPPISILNPNRIYNKNKNKNNNNIMISMIAVSVIAIAIIEIVLIIQVKVILMLESRTG